MEEVYVKLRDKLDQLGFGYPATENGVEFTLIENLFTPEDAEWFLAMKDGFQTPAEFAAENGKDRDAVAKKLEEMAKKGLLFRVRKGDEVRYRTIPTFHGLFEFNLNRLDPQWLGGLFGHILGGGLGQKVNATDTPFYRTVPVHSQIASASKILPYDNAEAIIKGKNKIAVAKCVCRASQVELGNGCNHPLETCLSFDEYAEYYLENGLAREISKEEALEIVKNGEKEGRITQVANSQNVEIMCSCCSCCCGILMVGKMFGGAAREVISNYYSQIDEELCTGDCHEICQGRCLTGALTLTEGKIHCDLNNCIGCGLCVTKCPNHAISLVKKSDEKLYEPPAALFDSYERMQDYRKSGK